MTAGAALPSPGQGDAAALRLVPLVAAAAGDAGAFAQLVGATRGVVCAITLALTRDVHASEDVAQDVYLDAWRGLARLRSPTSFLPWLRALARNRARMAVRGMGRRRRREGPALDGDAREAQHEAQLAATADAAPDALERLLDAEARGLLAEALAAVPDAAREVLILCYREECSVRQVAELLGLTEATVRQRLARARRGVRAEYLARAGDALGRTAPGLAFVSAVTSAVTGAVSSAVLLGATPGVAAAVGAGHVAARSSVFLKLGAKLGLTAGTGAAVAGIVGGLVGGLTGVAAGTRRQLSRAGGEAERRAVRHAGGLFAAGLVAFLVLLAAVRRPLPIAAGYALLVALVGWLQLRHLPGVRTRPLGREAYVGFVAGAVGGALPVAWYCWRALTAS